VNEKHEKYRLKGILTHAGMSEAGHYTSYIRTSENTWHYFDDERITDFDIKDL
jgi:ubiquitin C-terminal hydrolase